MLAGFLLFIIYIICLLIALRAYAYASPTSIVCMSALIVYLFGLLAVNMAPSMINFFSFSSIYWCFTLIFLMIFGAVYKSISLRMMLHLLQQPNKTDGYQVILADCIKNQSYAQRLEILLDKQMIVEQLDGTYHLTQKGRSIASKIHSLQQFFAIQESG